MMRPAASVCHDEQLRIWSSEIREAILDYLATELSYSDGVDLDLAVQREIKRIIGDAFGMAETDLLESE